MAATARVIMAVRMREVMARPWVGVCVPLAYFNGNSYSTFATHVLVELLWGSQPTAPTCVVWTQRLIDCYALSSAVRFFFSWYTGPAASWCMCAPCFRFALFSMLQCSYFFARWHLAIAITSNNNKIK